MQFSVGMVGNRGEQADYRSEELEQLQRIDALFEHNLHQHPSFGKVCNTGSTVITVDGSGDVQRCHFVNTSYN